MKLAVLHLNGLASRAKPPAILHFHVTAIYDGFTASVYAQEAVESLAMALRPALPIDRSMWSFDRLGSPEGLQATFPDAPNTDVIIVAASAACPLPLQVKSWLDHCLSASFPKRPLIVALHPDDPACPKAALPLYNDLTRVAERWHTTLLDNEEFDHGLDNGLAAELSQNQSPIPFPRPQKQVGTSPRLAVAS
jgi:hypothetical protein